MGEKLPCKHQSKDGQSDYIKSNKVDFRAKYITKDKKYYFIAVKGSNHQMDINILNFYTPTDRSS